MFRNIMQALLAIGLVIAIIQSCAGCVRPQSISQVRSYEDQTVTFYTADGRKHELCLGIICTENQGVYR